MPILPTARQNTRRPRRENHSRDDAERSLIHAFAMFTRAADSLEKSYEQLQIEGARLSGKLERWRLFGPFLPRVSALGPAELLPGEAVQSLGVIG